jgi:hypothetical protein
MFLTICIRLLCNSENAKIFLYFSILRRFIEKITDMKRVCIFAALLFLTVISYSQKGTTKTDDSTDSNIQKELTKIPRKVNPDTLTIEELNLYSEQAVNLRNTGRFLTLGGVGVMVAGFVAGAIIANNQSTDLDQDSLESTMEGVGVIYVAGLLGIASTAAGIPLWAVGGSRKAKAELTLKKFNIVYENSMAVGLGIKISF